LGVNKYSILFILNSEAELRRFLWEFQVSFIWVEASKEVHLELPLGFLIGRMELPWKFHIARMGLPWKFHIARMELPRTPLEVP
jgi:hypothetical protein